jgi:hypothetical protein
MLSGFIKTLRPRSRRFMDILSWKETVQLILSLSHPVTVSNHSLSTFFQEVEAELTKAGASTDQIKQIGPHKAFLGNR